MADSENKTSKSSIYQERDFLLDMTSCSLFMLAQATSIGNGAVVQRLLESKEQMNLFGEMIEILLTSLPNIYSSKSIEDSQIGQYKSLIMAMLSTFCNILADENGRNWFIESRSKTKIAKRLIEFKSLIKTESSEERLLRSIFANLKGSLDVIGLENEEINQIKKHF